MVRRVTEGDYRDSRTPYLREQPPLCPWFSSRKHVFAPFYADTVVMDEPGVSVLISKPDRLLGPTSLNGRLLPYLHLNTV